MSRLSQHSAVCVTVLLLGRHFCSAARQSQTFEFFWVLFFVLALCGQFETSRFSNATFQRLVSQFCSVSWGRARSRLVRKAKLMSRFFSGFSCSRSAGSLRVAFSARPCSNAPCCSVSLCRSTSSLLRCAAPRAVFFPPFAGFAWWPAERQGRPNRARPIRPCDTVAEQRRINRFPDALPLLCFCFGGVLCSGSAVCRSLVSSPRHDETMATQHWCAAWNAKHSSNNDSATSSLFLGGFFCFRGFRLTEQLPARQKCVQTVLEFFRSCFAGSSSPTIVCSLPVCA
jgi:hypothetical protein